MKAPKNGCEGCQHSGIDRICSKCPNNGRRFKEACAKIAPKSPTLPQERLKPKRQPKYRNRVFERNGEKYRSEKEYVRHMMLIQRLHCSAISNLRREVPYELIPSVILNGRKKPPIRYVADFVYYLSPTGKVIEDTKSPITRKNPVYRLKKHLMKFIHNIEILET